MTRLFSFLFLVMVFSCQQGRQPGQPDNHDTVAAIEDKPVLQQPAATPDPIAAIRQKVEQINTFPLEKKHFEWTCDEKMMADYFFYKGEIVKIAVDFGTVGDVYAKEGYYYDNGQLIFVYEYVEGGPACEGCIKTNEYRSYIRDNKTIRFLKDSAVQQCKKCEFGPASRQYQLLRASTAEQVKAIVCR